ncbi:MAG: hypothetical protein BWK76_15365 [Desulfobulbaceae bacterium A2]|nr:MAG: hypothetical protein BWK76_15365 [Desulfobulbaceae bacterium A2]
MARSLPQGTRRPACPGRSGADEGGFVLVILLLLLTLLTFLGIASTSSTTSELRISGNDRVYKQTFYNAEAGVAYAVQRGVSFFLGMDGTPNSYNALNPIPADLPANVTLQYDPAGGSPPIVRVMSTATAPGGNASTVILAGIIGTTPGSQQQPDDPLTGF